MAAHGHMAGHNSMPGHPMGGHLHQGCKRGQDAAGLNNAQPQIGEENKGEGTVEQLMKKYRRQY